MADILPYIQHIDQLATEINDEFVVEIPGGLKVDLLSRDNTVSWLYVAKPRKYYRIYCAICCVSVRTDEAGNFVRTHYTCGKFNSD